MTEDNNFLQRNFVRGPLKVVWTKLGNYATVDIEAALRARAADVVAFAADPAALGALPADLSPGTRFTVGAVSLGYVRKVARLRGVTLGLGGMGTLNVVPSTLRDVYGSRTPVGGLVFLRLRPIRGRMAGMGPAAPARGGMEHGGHAGG